MGNRLMTQALVSLVHQMKGTPWFDELVLVAPDVDADTFRRDLAPKLGKTAHRVTLYASATDEALALSQKLHGYPRAGDAGKDLVVTPGVETIDVSQVDTGLIGHSYYDDNETVLTDLFYLLHASLPAAQRPWLRPTASGSLVYWSLTPGNIRLGQTLPADAPARQ
jgi:esterase/lipase superfamily enzyme